jgi:signal transduction histidine kinase
MDARTPLGSVPAHGDGPEAARPDDAGAPDFAAAFEATPGINLILAADPPRFTMLAASDERLAATLTTREDTLGRPLFEVFSDGNPENARPSGVTNLRASLETVLRTRAPHRMAVQRYDLRRPDGAWEVRYWAPRNVPVLGPDGAVRYLLHHVEDVTEAVRRTEAHDRLRGEYAESEDARRALEDANARLQDQQLELELANQQLQEQAAELEQQAEELQSTAAQLEERTEEAERERARVAGSEAKYRALFESIDEGFAVIELHFDAEGRAVDYRFVEANSAFEQQTGLAGAVGRTVRELVPGIEEHWIETYGRVAVTGEPTRFQSGSDVMGRWFDVFAFRLGRPEERRVALLFTDVSAQRAAERERERLLRELELERARLAYVFQRAPSFLAILRLRDREYVFELVNDAYYQLVGHRDIVGKRVWEALPEVRGQGFEALLDGVVETGEPFIGREVPLRVQRTPDAPVEERFVDLAYMPLVEADGTRTGVIAHGSDVTEQVLARRAVERARDRADRLQALTAALAAATEPEQVAEVVVAQAVAATGAATGALLLRANDDPDQVVMLRQTGLTPGVVAGFSRVPLATDSPSVRCIRTGAPNFLPTSEALHAEFPALASTWADLGTRALATVPLAIGGEMVGAMSFTFTAPREFATEDQALFLALGRQAAQALERARLLAAERTARAEAEAAEMASEEASRAKSGFLATMSHELRTPINAMIGYTQLLDLGLAGPLTEQQRDYLARLTRSSEHLLALINDVLDLSKIEAGELTAQREDAWTGPAVEAAMDLARPLAAARGVVLEDRCPGPSGVRYVGDDQRVRQILINLLSNAVKFTESGGRITVASGTEGEAAPAARVHGRGPWAWVRVEDTGIGIAPEQLARIFEPFHQVDAGHTRKQGGTGLGLAISRRLARAMGGDLVAESVPRRGSTFTLWLPASADVGESASARRDRAEPERAPVPDTHGLAQAGEALRASLHEVLAAYADRLRGDPALPQTRAMASPELEDHHFTLLADLAQSLVIIGAAGPEAPELLRDGSAIQRIVAERHGVRRRDQGWSEAAVLRGYDILRAEVERAVGRWLRLGAAAAPGARGTDAGAAIRVLHGLIDKAEAESLRAWRRAASDGAPAEMDGA